MIMRWFIVVLSSLLFTSTLYANNNPFEKNVVVNVGSDVPWRIHDGAAVKTVQDRKGKYIHLIFDNKQLRLTLTRDEAGKRPEQYSQLGIRDVRIDGKTLPSFSWCLKHQTRQNRFLEQDLSVQDNRCIVDGKQGEFILQMDAATLKLLTGGKRLVFIVKPYRTPLKVIYKLSDFKNMTIALVMKSPTKSAAVVVKHPVVAVKKKCWINSPAKYSRIKSVTYNCDNTVAKKSAKRRMTQLVATARVHEKQMMQAEQEKLKLTQEKNRRAQEAKRKQQEKLRKQRAQQQAEMAAVAASKVKQSQISSEITTRMVAMCKKLWDKNEHRCYCQKYISFAPANIKATSTCK